MEGSQLWYKPHRLLGSCGVCDTLGVTRLRLVTPWVYPIHHSFLGVYLSLNPHFSRPVIGGRQAAVTQVNEKSLRLKGCSEITNAYLWWQCIYIVHPLIYMFLGRSSLAEYISIGFHLNHTMRTREPQWLADRRLFEQDIVWLSPFPISPLSDFEANDHWGVSLFNYLFFHCSQVISELCPLTYITGVR